MGKWQIRNGTCSASYAFERVHRFSVEAAMRLMLLLMLLLLRRQSALVTDTNYVPRDMINVDRKGRYHTRRRGDGGASGVQSTLRLGRG